MESARGCGWRKIGGFYLVGAGVSVVCDALPIPLEPCGECGFKVPFTRGIEAIHIGYLASKLKDHECKETFTGCPICDYVRARKWNQFFLMFVSKSAYTPQSFIKEAQAMSVSKRINPKSLPRKFNIGYSWIYLAHKEVPIYKREEGHPILNGEPELTRAIFHAFKPERIEVLVWEDDLELIKAYREQGYTPVLIERTMESEERHLG